MQKEFDQIGGGGGGGGAPAAEDVMNRKPTTKPDNTSRNHRQQQQQQQHPQEPQQCPRCDSFNTKFCYYNNYSLSQPRFFCKACRRYWTRGGTLRNVPVGGGCRKGKRTNHSSSSSSAAAAAVSSHSLPPPRPQHNFASASNLLGLSPSPVLRAAKPPSENPLLQPMLAPYYGGATAGGFLSSLTSIQPQPQQQQHPSFSNSVGYYNSLNVLNGFENFSPPPSSFGGNYQNHQQRQIQQQQIQEQEECLEEKIPEASVLCPPPSDHQGNLLMNATVRDWDQQGFNYVSSSNPTVSSAPEFSAGDFWNTNPNPESSSSLNPSATHWPPHLP